MKKLRRLLYKRRKVRVFVCVNKTRLPESFFRGEGVAVHTQATINRCRRPLRDIESHVSETLI